jgi:hypothetical protein
MTDSEKINATRAVIRQASTDSLIDARASWFDWSLRTEASKRTRDAATIIHWLIVDELEARS